MNTDKIKEHGFLNSRESAGSCRDFFPPRGDVARKRGHPAQKIFFFISFSHMIRETIGICPRR
jgi:hypothetical protein